VITVTDVAYDDPVAVALVTALHHDINHRYAYAMVDWTDAERAEDDRAYLAEVTPELVRAPHGAFLVAWRDGEPVGCGAVKPHDPEARVGEVKRMYTAPSARRQGVSRLLLAELERRARDLGYRRLQLETGTAQPEALALYEAAGWRRITPYGRYKDDPDSVCFGKDLANVVTGEASAPERVGEDLIGR